MRTSRFIFYTVIGTVLCLFYVFQQTQITKLGYRITTAQKMLNTVMDRKTYLEYTASSLESPLHLDKTLFVNNAEFEMPQHYRLVKVSTSPTVKVASSASALKRFAFATFFGGRSAEAKPVK